MALLMDLEHGTQENMPVDVLTRGLNMLGGFKSGIVDPDTPNMRQAMQGTFREQFVHAMEEEITELEGHDTWEELPRSEIPEGENVLPSTWAYKVKRYPMLLVV